MSFQKLIFQGLMKLLKFCNSNLSKDIEDTSKNRIISTLNFAE